MVLRDTPRAVATALGVSQRTVAKWLAVILHRMWVDGTDFRWSTCAMAAPAA
jgi:hypothetical protein